MYKAKIAAMTPADQKKALEQFGPVVTHIELAEYALISTDKGDIKAKFSYDDAPHAIDNFISLARRLYDNSAFHRIISGFMIQGGDAYANGDKAGQGGPGYDICPRILDKKHVPRRASPWPAPAAMSATPGTTQTTQYDTAGSQFFIMHGPAPPSTAPTPPSATSLKACPSSTPSPKPPANQVSGTVAVGARPKIKSIKILPATPEIYGLKK